MVHYMPMYEMLDGGGAHRFPPCLVPQNLMKHVNTMIQTERSDRDRHECMN